MSGGVGCNSTLIKSKRDHNEDAVATKSKLYSVQTNYHSINQQPSSCVVPVCNTVTANINLNPKSDEQSGIAQDDTSADHSDKDLHPQVQLSNCQQKLEVGPNNIGNME